MTLTLDSEAQLRGGIEYALQVALAGLVAPEGIRSDWPDPDMVRAVSAQIGGLNPLVVVSLGQSGPSRTQPSSPAQLSVTAPLTQGQTQATVLTRSMEQDTPVTLTVVAAGLEGKALRAQVVSRIYAALGLATSIPLPDSLEQANMVPGGGWTPSMATFSLRAQLVYTGSRPDNRDVLRQLHRQDVMYTATHDEWTALDAPLVLGTDATLDTGPSNGPFETEVVSS